MLGLTIIAMNIWGPTMIQYKDFSNAFLSVLLMQMGKFQYFLFTI